MRLWIPLLFPLLLAAQMLGVGDAVGDKSIADQFGTPVAVGKEAVWIVTWDKLTTRSANRYFEAHPQMLRSHDAALIVDVSQTPSGIMEFFVLPRMRSYEHPILLSYDAGFNRSLPYEEGKLTVLSLHEGRIAAVAFAADEAELERLLQPQSR